jgi:hypothetical protein
MKKAFFLYLLTAAGLCAEIATLNLGSHGQITLYFPDGWEANVTEMGGQATLTAMPKTDANATCSIAVSFPEEGRFRNRSRLKTAVESAGAAMVESGAVEGKTTAKEFLVTTGFGYYCSFIDPNLRGKPPIKGDYKVVSIGKILVAPDILIDVQVMADSFTEPSYQELLGAIEGMEFKK